jgi:hypothetical protein
MHQPQEYMIKANIIQQITRFYDSFFSRKNELKIERVIVTFAIIAFISHAGLIVSANFFELWQDSPFTGQNLLSAITTPLTIILFYEVLHLVLSLPKSIILSIKVQFQIASLILIREVFKYLGKIEDFAALSTDTALSRQILIYLTGSILSFLLVAFFTRVGRAAAEKDHESTNPTFISIKKVVSFVLVFVLFISATLSALTVILRDVLQLGIPSYNYLVSFFYLIIFIDVLLFLVSMYFTDDYGIVFMDSAFVIATIFIRLALASQGVFKVGVVILSILSGIAVVSIYYYFWNKDSHEPHKPSVTL